ncbi:unnamed protein product [Amoebophrya sp. A25]|nr:unnamed protein product [Amoebophrya sp. A25]|eukprot:GSA25T00003963001.1
MAFAEIIQADVCMRVEMWKESGASESGDSGREEFSKDADGDGNNTRRFSTSAYTLRSYKSFCALLQLKDGS